MPKRGGTNEAMFQNIEDAQSDKELINSVNDRYHNALQKIWSCFLGILNDRPPSRVSSPKSPMGAASNSRASSTLVCPNGTKRDIQRELTESGFQWSIDLIDRFDAVYDGVASLGIFLPSELWYMILLAVDAAATCIGKAENTPAHVLVTKNPLVVVKGTSDV